MVVVGSRRQVRKSVSGRNGASGSSFASLRAGGGAAERAPGWRNPVSDEARNTRRERGTDTLVVVVEGNSPNQTTLRQWETGNPAPSGRSGGADSGGQSSTAGRGLRRGRLLRALGRYG